MHTPVREVALLALLYRECYRNRWTSIDGIQTDQEICPGELSWLSMLAALLPQADWQVIATLVETDRFEAVARCLDPIRAEAVLHAALPRGVHPSGSWGEPYRERWGEVRSRMRLFVEEGYTTNSDGLDGIASAAWHAATGDTFEQYLDRWEYAL
jgi:hypothetical protein